MTQYTRGCRLWLRLWLRRTLDHQTIQKKEAQGTTTLSLILTAP